MIRKDMIKGLLLCLAISIPSWYLGKTFSIVGGPVFGILIGMVVTQLIPKLDSFRPGIKYSSKMILQYAVILLGFGLNFTQILDVGARSLPIILSTITTSLLTAYIVYRITKMPENISMLIGIGSSICGGSAIAAAAPVIDAKDEEIAQAISVIFFFNVIAALTFPTLGGLMGMTNDGFAMFAGTAINDTSSVTAAAAAWDGIHNSNVLESATIVKLTRTLAIVPITLVLAFLTAKKKKETKELNNFSLSKIFPTFILFFLLAAGITTVFSLQPNITGPLKELSKFAIIMAMSGIGLSTNIIKLVKSGGKPIFLGFTCFILIAVVSITMQKVLGIW